MAEFVHGYNTDHRHSGIGYITPDQRHSGKVVPIMQFRNEVLKKAYKVNPERWNGNPVFWSEYPVVYLNPSLETRRILKERKSS